MTASISWVHIGDLHVDEAVGWRSKERLEQIVTEVRLRVLAWWQRQPRDARAVITAALTPCIFLIAGSRAIAVDTVHTRYNEFLNDGRVVYGATRSTGQIDARASEFRRSDKGLGRWTLRREVRLATANCLGRAERARPTHSVKREKTKELALCGLTGDGPQQPTNVEAGRVYQGVQCVALAALEPAACVRRLGDRSARAASTGQRYGDVFVEGGVQIPHEVGEAWGLLGA